MTTAFEDLLAAEATFAAAKKAYTAKLAGIAAKYNAGQPILAADWNALTSGAYNPLTDASNAFRALATTLEAGLLIDMAAARIDAPATSIDQVQQFTANYFTMASALLLCPDAATAADLADKICAGVKKGVADCYAAAPDTLTVLDNSPINAFAALVATNSVP